MFIIENMPFFILLALTILGSILKYFYLQKKGKDWE